MHDQEHRMVMRAVMAVVVVALIGGFLLVSCGSSGDRSGQDGRILPYDNWRAQVIQFKQEEGGGTYRCISATGNDHNGIAIQCDWAHPISPPSSG